MTDLLDKREDKTEVAATSKQTQATEGIRAEIERYLAEGTSSCFEMRSQRALTSLKEVLDVLREVDSPKNLDNKFAKRLMEQHPNDIRLIKPCGKSYIRMYLVILKEIVKIQESVNEEEQTLLYKVAAKKPISDLIAVLEQELNGEVV